MLTRKDFMGDHEWCFYGWREGAAHQFFGPNNATDLWAIKKVNPQSMIHLTEKPVELAARAMEYSSKPGENVLDLFGGSGSTLIAAEQTGRKAFLMELDPLYCDVIVQRYEQFTGKKAERTGVTSPAGPRGAVRSDAEEVRHVRVVAGAVGAATGGILPAAFGAFCVYRDLGPRRSLRAAAAAVLSAARPPHWGASSRSGPAPSAGSSAGAGGRRLGRHLDAEAREAQAAAARDGRAARAGGPRPAGQGPGTPAGAPARGAGAGRRAALLRRGGQAGAAGPGRAGDACSAKN